MRISIVIPSFNQAKFVDQAIKSLISQDYEDLEIIFIDGGSSDGTMDVVNKFRDRLSVCISEPDMGQSDALSKGFSRASGQILSWLNTDDLLLPGALSQVARAARMNPSCEWFLGNVIWISDEGKIIHCRRGEKYLSLWPRLGLLAATGPTAFFAPGLYERVGGVNRDLHYAMDTELWWKFIISGARFQRLENYTWALRLHADAKVSGHLFKENDTPEMLSASHAQMLETCHINELRKRYQVGLNPRLLSTLILMGKAVSPRYLRSVAETFCWEGCHVKDVLKYEH